MPEPRYNALNARWELVPDSRAHMFNPFSIDGVYTSFPPASMSDDGPEAYPIVQHDPVDIDLSWDAIDAILSPAPQEAPFPDNATAYLGDETIMPTERNPRYECYLCGNRRVVHTTIPIPGGSAGQVVRICGACAATHIQQCRQCNTTLSSVGLATDQRRYAVRTATGEVFYCYTCYSRAINAGEFIQCQHCSGRYETGTEFRTMNDGRSSGMCPRCWNQRVSQLNGVMAYDANILDYLPVYPEPKDNLRFGVELEVQSTQSLEGRVEAIRELFPDFAICKHDGSVNDDENKGFEIVTVPADMDSQKKEWEKFFTNAPLVRSMYSWKSGMCGMHVHFSRKAVSPLDIGKILVFMNSPTNALFVSVIAGRGSSRYTRSYEKTIGDALAGPVEIPPVNQPKTRYGKNAGMSLRDRLLDNIEELNHDHRYEAVNLTNRHTIEIRVFRGTLKRESFFKNLEFVHALVKYVKVAGMSMLDHKNFCKWLAKNRKEYPFLASFLELKGYITPVMKKEDPAKKTEKDFAFSNL